MTDNSEVFTPYDTADYLTSREQAAAYLEAAIEDGGTTRRSSRRPLGPSPGRATSANWPGPPA